MLKLMVTNVKTRFEMKRFLKVTVIFAVLVLLTSLTARGEGGAVCIVRQGEGAYNLSILNGINETPLTSTPSFSDFMSCTLRGLRLATALT